MKQNLHIPKAGLVKQKETKTKGRVGDEASQNRMPKQTKINKSRSMKSPSSNSSKKKSHSSVKSQLKEVNGKLRTKKSKEKNLDSVGTKDDKSRKRKRDEEQKKSKSISTKSATKEAKRKKENIVEAMNKNSGGRISPLKPPSQKMNSESRIKDHYSKHKKPKTTAAKTTGKKPSSPKDAKPSQKLVKGSKFSKPEKGKKKKQKENGTDKKLKPNNPNSKPEKNAKHHDSFSREEKAGSSRSEGQTKIAVQKKPRPNSSTILVEKSRPSNARRLKIMRALALAPPIGSPFVSHGTIL